MKKPAFPTEQTGSGFIRTTLTPVNDKRESCFSLWDAVEVFTLILAILVVMRFLVAH